MKLRNNEGTFGTRGRHLRWQGVAQPPQLRRLAGQNKALQNRFELQKLAFIAIVKGKKRFLQGKRAITLQHGPWSDTYVWYQNVVIKDLKIRN